MRQVPEGLKGRATLEIHQDEIDDARVVTHRQGRDQGKQQLGLSRTGRAGDHSMHSVAVGLGGENQAAHLSAADQAERRTQPLLILRLHAVFPIGRNRDLSDLAHLLGVQNGVHLEHGHRPGQLGRRAAAALRDPDLLHPLGDDCVGILLAFKHRHCDVELERLPVYVDQASPGNVIQIEGAPTDDIDQLHVV